MALSKAATLYVQKLDEDVRAGLITIMEEMLGFVYVLEEAM